VFTGFNTKNNYINHHQIPIPLSIVEWLQPFMKSVQRGKRKGRTAKGGEMNTKIAEPTRRPQRSINCGSPNELKSDIGYHVTRWGPYWFISFLGGWWNLSLDFGNSSYSLHGLASSTSTTVSLFIYFSRFTRRTTASD
jgi:hypothetical protein